MAVIKSHTDLPQSKVLSQILPLESADMLILNSVGESGNIDGTNCTTILKENLNPLAEVPEILPCWSLAALLAFLPNSAFLERGSVTELYRITLPIELVPFDWYVEPVDACVEMIIHLHELKML